MSTSASSPRILVIAGVAIVVGAGILLVMRPSGSTSSSRDRDAASLAAPVPTGEPAAEHTSWPAGIAWCRDYGSEPVIHRVTNAGGEAIRLIGAEVRASPAVKAPHALKAKAYQLKYEDTRIRVYRLDLAPGETTGVVDYDFSALFVAVSPTCLALRTGSRSWIQQIEAGDIHWHRGPMQAEVSNSGTEAFRAYLAEWL